MRNLRFYVIALCLIFLAACSSAQNTTRQKNRTNGSASQKSIDGDKLLSMRDSVDRLLVVNTRSSAILVRLGQVEFYSNNLLSSMNYSFDRNGDNAFYKGQDLIFSSFAQASLGVSKRRRLNIGVDANYTLYRHDNTTENSVLSIFNNEEGTISTFTYAGPRIKIQPLKRVNNFVYQTYVWLPLVNDATRLQIGIRDWYWGHSLFYYKYFKQTFGVSGQFNFSFAKQKDAEREIDDINFDMSFGATVSYVLLKRNVLYVPLLYARANQDVSQVMEGADSDLFQYGLGYQRVFSRRFQMNVSYSTILFAHNYGKWKHMNLGIRYVF